MTAKEFLRSRNVITGDTKDLIIGFDNDTEESLIELLDDYHEKKLLDKSKCMYCEKELKTEELIVLCKECTE